MTRYTKAPFSGKNYRKNSELGGEGTIPCGICGKPVKTEGHPHWACVVDGGAAWGDDDSDPTDSGYMGGWPIGNDCHRKYLVPKPAQVGDRWVAGPRAEYRVEAAATQVCASGLMLVLYVRGNWVANLEVATGETLAALRARV